MKIHINIIFILILNISFGQDKVEQASKMQEFVSQTGVIIKFENYDLPNLKLNYGICESNIKKIIARDEIQYFLQFSKKGEYDTKTASIAFEDILEIQKALNTLISQAEIDANTTSDYLENKFVTDDGFQIGYYVKSNKVKWYAVLEKYGTSNTIFLKDSQEIKNSFELGKNKIEELKLE